jgi:hypothetical protein
VLIGKRVGQAKEKLRRKKMAEIRVPIPEIGEILTNQKEIMQMLRALVKTPVSTVKFDTDQLLSGPEILHYLKCGRKKLKELVAKGKIEKVSAFGTRPRYKISQHEDAS